MPLALNAIWKKFCGLQKKVLSFGPNRTVEVRPNRTFGLSLEYIPAIVVPHPLTTAWDWGAKDDSGRQALLTLLLKVNGVFNFTMLISLSSLVAELYCGWLITSFIKIVCWPEDPSCVIPALIKSSLSIGNAVAPVED